MVSRRNIFNLFCIALISVTSGQIFSRSLYQDVKRAKSEQILVADTLGGGKNRKDSLLRDTVRRDTLNSKDSLTPKGSLAMPAFSGAKDSVIEDFSNGKKIIYYYGDVTVKYGNMELNAAYMEYNMDTKTVFASGVKDTAGILQGKPVMKEGNSKYEMKTIYYNFDSRKAKITEMITQESEGFLHGNTIKKMPDNSINISKGMYTTCDLKHPHFYLQMTNAKVVNQPNKVTVFGPAYLVVEDVPTPFALPFGFVPNQVKKTSGLLIPTFNEENARGFGLQGLGYYFVFGDHFDASITADLYSMGSWNLVGETRYKKRYKYDGSFGFNYSKNQVGEKGGADFYQSQDFSVRWSHSQDSKARPGTTFRASVNFSTPLNNRFNSYDIQNSLQNQISSSVSYTKTFADSPFTLSVNMLHSQNSLDSSYAVTLPNMTLTMNKIFPFKRKEAVGKGKFYEQFNFSYNTTLDNKVNFKAKDFGGPDFLSKFKSGMKHSFSIGLPTFSLMKYITVAPGVNYGMNWYFQSSQKEYDSQTKTVNTQTSDLFSQFGVTQDFAASLSMNTTMYGVFNFGKAGRIQAIRHMISPSLSLNYVPELGTPGNGYRHLSYIDANGVQQTLEYNRYEGLVYGYPGKGKSAGMGFSIANNLEAKVRSDEDSTGLKKIKLIDNLSLGGSYNFMADSMRLSNISMTMSTTVFGKLGFSANAMFDPYAIDGKGKRIAQFNIVKEGGLKLARLTNASVSLSYQLSGKGERSGGVSDANKKKETEATTGAEERSVYNRVYTNPITGEYIPGGWVYYYDPSLNWSLNFNYNYSFSRSYQYASNQLNVINNHMQTLGISGQIKFYRDLSVNMNTGLDVMKMKLTTTQLNATYDLHCFQISVSWVPNGMWQSWSFRINAKASALADLLKYKKNASYWDRSNYK